MTTMALSEMEQAIGQMTPEQQKHLEDLVIELRGMPWRVLSELKEALAGEQLQPDRRVLVRMPLVGLLTVNHKPTGGVQMCPRLHEEQLATDVEKVEVVYLPGEGWVDGHGIHDPGPRPPVALVTKISRGLDEAVEQCITAQVTRLRERYLDNLTAQAELAQALVELHDVKRTLETVQAEAKKALHSYEASKAREEGLRKEVDQLRVTARQVRVLRLEVGERRARELLEEEDPVEKKVPT